jgi:hypothetical protein
MTSTLLDSYLAATCRLVSLALLAAALPAPAWAGVPDGTPYVDSKTRPIRVYYEAARVKQPDAEGFLAPLEDAWTATVDGMGFAVPKRLVDGAVAPGFDLYIKYFSGDYGMTFEVLGDDPSTPEADCPTLGVVNSRVLSMAGVGLEVAWHLLNHASMHATDCLEPALPAYDMFTLAAQVCASPALPYDWASEVQTFQQYPEWSLDAVGQTSQDVYYSFGSALFMLFLEEHFGARDGKLLAQMWSHTPQPGHVTSVDPNDSEVAYGDVANNPSFFDAIGTTLSAQGSSFDEAYSQFALWRFLVGDRDDGHHFRDASTYPTPFESAHHLASELPIQNAAPTRGVARYGTSYVTIDPAGLGEHQALRLQLSAYKPFRWSADAVCVNAGAPAKTWPIELNSYSMGSVLVPDAATCKEIALAVSNLSEGGYDVNAQNWGQDGQYRYSLSALAMPAALSVTPSSLEQGVQSAHLAVATSDFNDGALLSASLGDGLTVESVTVTDAHTVALTVSVAAGARLGSRDLSLTDGRGLVARLAEAVFVTAPAGPDAATAEPEPDAAAPDAAAELGRDAGAPDASAPAQEPDNGAGCGCQGAGSASASLLGLLALGGWIRRARRA